MECRLCRDKRPKRRLSSEARDYHVCSRCGLIFMDPSFYLSPSESKARYLLHNNSEKDQRYIDFLSRLSESCIKYIDRGDNCLDYGCGQSKAMALIFSSKGFNMDSYDPLFYPDIKNKNYDLITCNEVIEHFFNPILEFKKLRTLMSRNGLLGISTSLYDEKTDFSKWYYIKDPTHVSFYSFRTIAYVSQLFSFKITDVIDSRVIILKNI